MCMPIIAVVGTVVKVLLGNEEMDHKAASQTGPMTHVMRY